jgi:hypothetical protein
MNHLQRRMALGTVLVLMVGCQKVDPSLMSPLGVGATAPTIEAAGWLNGTPPPEESLKDRVIVLDCWAHW